MQTVSEIVKHIVSTAHKLNNIYLPEEVALVNYSAIFCQNEIEFKGLNDEVSQLGVIAEDTPTGFTYKLHKPINTVAGPLSLIKIRKPDVTRTQRGDADFIVRDYDFFKNKVLANSDNFSLIQREKFEMIELHDSRFDVLCYFSNPPLVV